LPNLITEKPNIKPRSKKTIESDQWKQCSKNIKKKSNLKNWKNTEKLSFF
jgi:hypothetical protein